MIVVDTQNSTYEIDTVGKLVRRTRGAKSPTDRFGWDEEWCPYVDITAPVLGGSLIITWPDGQPNLRDHTVTSAVKAFFVKDETAD